MAVTINEEECVACGACEGVCPQEALSVDDKAKVDGDKCVDCGACIDACPAGAISE